MNEATSRQASKQTQSVLAGEATSRQASKHSRCKHNLDDAASADTHSSLGPKSQRQMNQLAGTIDLPQI